MWSGSAERSYLDTKRIAIGVSFRSFIGLPGKSKRWNEVGAVFRRKMTREEKPESPVGFAADRSSPRWISLSSTLTGLLVLVVGFSFCVAYGISSYPWTDEIQTQTFTKKSFSELWDSYYTHRTYAILAKISVCLLGDNVIALRLPAAVMGILSLAAVYFYGYRLFGRWTGLLAGWYLAIHPLFLQNCKEARGFSGGVLFLTLGGWLLWEALDNRKTLYAFLSVFCYYLAYLFHPTTAMVFPGVLLGILYYTGESLATKKVSIRSIVSKPKTLAGLAVLLASAFALAYPYLKSYSRWGSLFIPKHVLAEGQGESLTLPFQSVGSFLYYAAPLFTSSRHWGFSLYFALAMALFAVLGAGKGKLSRTLFILLPAISSIPFFWFVLFEKIPLRYLVALLPFVSLLCAAGVCLLASWVARRIPYPNSLLKRAPRSRALDSRFRGNDENRKVFPHRHPRESGDPGEGRPFQRTAKIEPLAAFSLSVILLGGCLGPFLAATLYGRKPGQVFYRPFVQLVSANCFRNWPVWFYPKENYIRNHLLTLGLPRRRVLQIPSGADNRITQARLHVQSEKGVWVCPTAPEGSSQAEHDLQSEGFVPVNLFGKRIYFLPPCASSEDEEARTVVGDILKSAIRDVHLDCRSEFALAGLAAKNGYPELETALSERARVKMERISLLDYPGRGHAVVNALVRYLLAKGRTLEAAKAYLREIGKNPTLVPAFYVETFENLPKSHWPHVVKLEEFDSKEFAEGFVSALDRSVGQQESHRARFATRLGNVLLHTGQFDAARSLFNYALRKGDPQGEARQFLGLLEGIEKNWSEEVMWQMCR